MTSVSTPELTPTPALPGANRRAAGILLHPTSLPGIYGIGDFGDELIAFLDWAQSAGITIWQVLPLNPTGYGASPYGCLSSFAGSHLMISPQRLMQEQLLDPAAVADVPHFRDDHVEFDRVHDYKFTLLRNSWQHFQEHATSDQRAALEAFVAAPEQNLWLADYALFMTLKNAAGGAAWWTWERPLALRDTKALEDAKRTYADEIRFWEYIQFLFFRQWGAVRDAARGRGIRIMGDVPIYVANDSADVWASPELFQLDEEGRPTVVAGVPPDYFSITGQRWGNPLYRWDVLRATGYRWWIERLRVNLRMADLVRLDHFRGFAAYWEVAAHEETAMHGRWMPGPRNALFDALREALGPLPLIAEDLGLITEDVHELRRSVGFPGMKVLQFGFAEPDSSHLPHHFEPETVVYTGTHDNDTTRGWFENASPDERATALAYLGCSEDADVARAMIRTAYTSVANIAITPAQDILGLGSEARMNTPGAQHDNWSWRIAPGALTHEHAAALQKLAAVTGRV